MKRAVLATLILCAALRAPAQPGGLPNGVAAGDATSTSVVLWARAASRGRVSFLLAEAGVPPAGTRRATRLVVDPAVPAKAEFLGLRPGTRYVYAATAPNGETLGGEFSTPGADGERRGLRFGVSGDWRGDLAPYPSVANAAGRSLDFFVALGDTVYADYPSDALPATQARTLADFRAKQEEVYSPRHGLNALADVRRSTVTFAMIDDHEVADDFAGGAPASSDPRFEGSEGELVNETPLFRNGLRAFQEYNPVREETYPPSRDRRVSGKPRLYRYRTFGADAALFLLDERSFRDAALPSPDPGAAADVERFLLRTFDVDPATLRPAGRRRTILGEAQLAELKRDLLDAEARGITWKFVLAPEPAQNLGLLEAGDRFEGYARERAELLDFVATSGLENVVFVTADIHGTLVNNLTYGRGPGAPQIPTDCWEIATGPVAFDSPFGPTLVGEAESYGLLCPGEKEQYEALPAAGEGDPAPAERDELVRRVLDAQLQALGYDLLGLGGSGIPAAVTRGSDVAVHTFGWTEFSIDRETRRLTVTTWGVPAYSRGEVVSSPEAVLSRAARVVGEIVVEARPARR